MYLTRCPTCGELSAVALADVGWGVACSRCLAVYTATVNETDNTREVFVRYVQERIAGAGVGLIILGVFGIGCAAIPLAVLGIHLTTGYQGARGQLAEDLLVFTTLTCSVLLSSVMMYGGNQMTRVRHYSVCVLAAVLAMLPFANLCCLVGWLVGPNALSYLKQPEVRKAFALNRGED